jgi:hypothetical protein
VKFVPIIPQGDAERLETIQAVREGLASADRGEGRPMDDVFDALEKELGAKADVKLDG